MMTIMITVMTFLQWQLRFRHQLQHRYQRHRQQRQQRRHCPRQHRQHLQVCNWMTHFKLLLQCKLCFAAWYLFTQMSFFSLLHVTTCNFSLSFADRRRDKASYQRTLLQYNTTVFLWMSLYSVLYCLYFVLAINSVCVCVSLYFTSILHCCKRSIFLYA